VALATTRDLPQGFVTHRKTCHSMPTICISTSLGVRQPIRRMAIRETPFEALGLRQKSGSRQPTTGLSSANRLYAHGPPFCGWPSISSIVTRRQKSSKSRKKNDVSRLPATTIEADQTHGTGMPLANLLVGTCVHRLKGGKSWHSRNKRR
jgi:hypothetical protein